MSKKERISSVDTAWLRMDRPHNLMMIVGIMMFDGPMDFDRLKRIYETRFCHYRRFRQRVVMETTGAYWEDDDDFDIDAHVRRVTLPPPAGKTQLQKYVAELITTPLDPNRPLWQALVVENYDGGVALVSRIHHCIADGIALMGVLLSLTDESPDAPDTAEPAPEPDDAGEGEQEDLLHQLIRPMSEAVSAATKYSGDLWELSKGMIAHPQQALDYARVGVSVAGELAYLATMDDDSTTRFKGKPARAKRVAWSQPMPLDDIKAVGKALDCSVNDILMSCAAGALRDYLVEKGDEVAGVEVRALVPVNLRPPGSEHRLGNRFGLVALSLPVGIENPMARLYDVRRRMDELKGSYQAPVTLGLLGAVGMFPKAVQQLVLDILAAKATAVMTNVPGPQKPLYLAGARLAEQMFWVPQSGDIGMGVSILSYDGRVQFGLVTDKRLVPDPENIVDRFQLEFEKIVYVLLMSPWGEKQAAETAPEESAEPAAKPKPARRRRPESGKKPVQGRGRRERREKSKA